MKISRGNPALAFSVLAIALVSALVATGCGGAKETASAAATVRSKPVDNFQFYYQRLPDSGDLSKFGKISLFVSSAPGDEKEYAAAIRKTGAKAFRYLQAYWFPGGTTQDTVNISENPDWQYCKSGNTPLVGRVLNGKPWYFVDNNSASWRAHLRKRLAQVKANGWDGVMFDRGLAALTGNDEEKAGIWDKASTCTKDPVVPGATAAEAFVGAMGEVKKAGLELIQNYGVSPFDSLTPFRPDPRDPQCQAQNWAQCKFTQDGMDNASYFLNEAVAHPQDQYWETDYRANQRNETDPKFGGRVLGLITEATLGRDVSRDNVYFQWARVKIFNIPVGVGTGDDRCPATKLKICNRFGVYGELNSVAYGTPLDAEPQSKQCAAGSTINCVWLRRYEGGMSVVNVSANEQTVELPATGVKCAKVVSVFDQQSLGACDAKLTITLPPWSGRPIVYEGR